MEKLHMYFIEDTYIECLFNNELQLRSRDQVLKFTIYNCWVTPAKFSCCIPFKDARRRSGWRF